MRLLAIDSSGMTASVAVLNEQGLMGEYTVNYKKTHSQTLLPMIDELLRFLEINKKDLDCIAVSEGPGSFTGLRIGAATAKGLALALDIPVAAVSTLEALAYNGISSENIVCPIMDARRNNVFTGLYKWNDYNKSEEPEIVMEQTAMEINELIEKINSIGEKVLFVGDGIGVYREVIAKQIKVPYNCINDVMRNQRASSVGAIGMRNYNNGILTHGDDFEPVYLRLSQAERELLNKKTGKSE
ncbi:MAG: tRNA (adenosine(37)-N6)-threonylcarbamoyltransferase complex dimerization subunit type 1 TsaB [Lachnospiraceae bacterium]|nr:tRNA (adenosine(37)-N6)-threonylcarbamoyltransferase complex dimerization subunit type 1 TsaB [Lachnospiraceae bacterium]